MARRWEAPNLIRRLVRRRHLGLFGFFDFWIWPESRVALKTITLSSFIKSPTRYLKKTLKKIRIAITMIAAE